jgi:hypothetical protein
VNGNTVTNDNSTITLSITAGTPGSGGPGTLSGCTQTETLGVITFSGCKIDTSGTGYRLHATALGLTAADSGTFNIAVGAASQFLVSPSTSSPTAGSAFTVTLTAQDAGGNTVVGYTGSRTINWTGPTASPNGTTPTLPVTTVNFVNGVSTTTLSATLFAAGSNALTATSAGVAGSTSLNVLPGPLGLSFSKPCSAFDTKKGSGMSNGKTTVTIQRGTDRYANPVADPGAGNPVVVTLGGSNGTWSPAGPVTLPGGTTTTGNETWTNANSATSTATPTASAPGYASASCSYTITN